MLLWIIARSITLTLLDRLDHLIYFELNCILVYSLTNHHGTTSHLQQEDVLPSRNGNARETAERSAETRSCQRASIGSAETQSQQRVSGDTVTPEREQTHALVR